MHNSSSADHRRRAAALLCATMLMGGTSAAAWAQDAAAPVNPATPTVATPANPDQTTAADPASAAGADASEIVVTGFRQSYADAIRTKRNEISISDGISSDGLGRFPDLNVGEALQRVPGVQINREAEGRNATINLRGLPGEYARLTFNGVAFAEPILTEAAPLGAFNSDIFSAIQVEKSPLANAQTGGLSGNVDLQVAPALSRKDGGFAKLAFEYNQLGKKKAPSGTVGYNYHITDDLAVFGVLAYKRENFRRDTIQFNSYTALTPAQAQANAGQVAAFYPTSAGCPSCTGATVSATGVLYNSQYRQYTRINEGDLYTAAGGLEYRVSDTAKLGVTGFYTDRNQPKTTQFIMIYSPNQNSAITALSAPELLSDGRRVIQNISFTNPDTTSSTRLFGQRQRAWGANVTGEWETDAWRAASITTLSRANNRSNETQLDFNTQQIVAGNGVTGTINTGRGTISDLSVTIRPDPATTTLAPNGWFYGGVGDPTSFYDSATPALRRNRIQFTGTQSYATNTLLASQFDLERKLDGFISAVQVGVRFEHNKYVSEGYRTSAFGIQVQNIDNRFLIQSPFAESFFGSKGGMTTNNWQVTDVGYAFPKLQPVTVFPGGELSPLGYNIRYNDNAYALFNFTNQNDLIQGYAQVKYDFELGSIRIRGNGGLRYERTRNKVTALDRISLTGTIGSPADFRERVYKNNYGKLLPSFIAVADLTDKLILRGAAYKTYVRPQPRQFTPSTVVGSPNGGVYSVTLGNPGLKPYDATSYDLSLEFYNRPNGIISLAAFQKRVTGLVAQISDPRRLCPSDPTVLNLGTLTVNGDQCQSSLIFTGGPVPTPFLVAASGFVNQPNPVKVRGVELNVQQNLDFLPGILKNLGGGFNYAYTTISGKNLNGSDATLPGVSEHNVNVIGYYETTAYGLRLVYNYRSSYDLASAGTFTGAARSVKARGQLDLSASVNVTPAFSLSFDAFNLTNAIRIEYENDVNLPRRVDYDGRTFAITARATF